MNKTWNCPNGHTIQQVTPFSMKALANTSDKTALTEELLICQICFVEWVAKTFPISLAINEKR